MKRKIYFVIFLFTLQGLISCKRPVTNIIIEVPVLRASYIYRTDSVDNYLGKYQAKNKEMSDAYFQKGLESENTNPDKAVFFIKRAITLYPCFKYYKELGSFNSKLGKYDEMHDVYTFIRNDIPDGKKQNGQYHIDAQLNPDIVYECLISNILSSKGGFVDDMEEDLEEDAKEMNIGILDLKDKVFSDPRLKLDSNSEDYQDLILNFFNAQQIRFYMAKPSTFNYFLSTIKDTTRVFEIDKNKVRDFDYRSFNGSTYRHEAGPENMLISEYFNHYLPEKIKDTNWDGVYNYTHVIHLNDSILAIICAIDSSESACPADIRQIYHRLTTFTKHGRMIASTIVANQSGESLSTLQFTHNKYTITYFKRYWEKPYKKNDFDNYLTKTEQLDKKSFVINPRGEITKDSTSAGNRTTP